MKIGFNPATVMNCSSLSETLVFCNRQGFDYIELRIDMLRDYLKHHSVSELKEFFESHSIKPHAFNAWLDINFLGEPTWEEKLNDFLFACEIGPVINNPYIIVCPTVSAHKVPVTDAQIIEDTVRNVRKLAMIAKEKGMKVAFEPVGISKSYVQTVEMGLEIVNQVGMPNVGLCIDSSNLYLNNKMNDFSCLSKLNPELIYVVHINDMDDLPISELDQCNRCLPGRGVIDLKGFIANLKKCGYDGIVSVETFRPEYWGMDAKDVIQMAYNETRKYLS